MIIEYGERKIENLSLKTAIALSKALGVLELKNWIELFTILNIF